MNPSLHKLPVWTKFGGVSMMPACHPLTQRPEAGVVLDQEEQCTLGNGFNQIARISWYLEGIICWRSSLFVLVVAAVKHHWNIPGSWEGDEFFHKKGRTAFFCFRKACMYAYLGFRAMFSPRYNLYIRCWIFFKGLRRGNSRFGEARTLCETVAVPYRLLVASPVKMRGWKSSQNDVTFRSLHESTRLYIIRYDDTTYSLHAY